MSVLPRLAGRVGGGGLIGATAKFQDDVYNKVFFGDDFSPLSEYVEEAGGGALSMLAGR